MRRFLAVTLLLLVLSGAGCRRPVPGEVYLAPGVPFRLCLPETGPDFFALQEVTFSFAGGRRETTMAAVENKGGLLSLVVSTPLGQTLFTVQVRGRAVLVDARIPLPPRLDPALLPALVQFSLWPEAAVRDGLEPGISFRQEGPRRTLLRRGQAVWTVTREGAAAPFQSLALESPALGLTVRIRTVEP
ncbi:MAG: DUF3261 domain-containing protein [Holophaga sp.]|nr:DUF3261 domain-containing protein [Holophaga sp.]